MCQRQTTVDLLSRRASALVIGCALLACVSCTSADDAPIGGTTTRPSPSSTTGASEGSGPSTGATVEGAYGCGPSDAREITITSRGLPDEPVVAQVVFADEVRTSSGPLRGPDIEVTLMPDLPSEAYEPGAAEVRIVAGAEVIVSARVQPDLPICG